MIFLCHKMNNFGCVLTKNERYVITMAGISIGAKDYDDIHVLDLHTMKTFGSDLKCPFDGCSVECKSRNNVKQHFCDKHMPKKFKCSKCNKKFSRKQLLKRHVKKYHETEDKCF